MNTITHPTLAHLEGLSLARIVHPVLPAPRTDISLEEAFAVIAAHKLNESNFSKDSLTRYLLNRKYADLQKAFKESLRIEGINMTLSAFLMPYSGNYLYADISFTTRQDLLNWLAAFNLSLPTAVSKSGNVREVNGTLHPYTTLEYRLELAFIHNDQAYKAEMRLSYQRDGLPSASCRITTTQVHEVVCDIGGSAPEEIPVG